MNTATLHVRLPDGSGCTSRQSPPGARRLPRARALAARPGPGTPPPKLSFPSCRKGCAGRRRACLPPEPRAQLSVRRARRPGGAGGFAERPGGDPAARPAGGSTPDAPPPADCALAPGPLFPRPRLLPGPRGPGLPPGTHLSGGRVRSGGRSAGKAPRALPASADPRRLQPEGPREQWTGRPAPRRAHWQERLAAGNLAFLLVEMPGGRAAALWEV